MVCWLHSVQIAGFPQTTSLNQQTTTNMLFSANCASLCDNIFDFTDEQLDAKFMDFLSFKSAY